MQISRAPKLTTKGQITIPKATRDFLKIGPGDRVKLFVHPEGHVAMLPVTSMKELRGIVKYSGKPVSIRKMDEDVANELSKRERRIRSAR